MSLLFVMPQQRPIGIAGRTLPLGLLRFYLSGTLTEAPVYDEDGDELEQPITADVTGTFPNVYLDETVAYRAKLFNAAGVEQDDWDPWTGLTAAAIGSNDGAGGSLWTTVAGFITYLRSSVGSAIVGFLQSGTGAAPQTVQDKLRVIRTVSDFYEAGMTDTQAVQRAIDRLIAFAAQGEGRNATLIIDGEYEVTGLTLLNATNLTITGGHLILLRQATVNNIPDNLREAYLFRPQGTSSNVLISRVKMTGPDDDAADSRHHGFYQTSGPNLDYITIEGCDFSDFNTAIAFNAESGGTVGQCIARGNRITNMVGTEGGQGYGLFANATDGVIFDGNFLDRTQRHAIYVAGSGDSYAVGVVVINNQSRNHRLGVTNGVNRPAFYFARTKGIIATGNQVFDYYDGALGLAQDTANGDDAGRAIIRGFMCFNRKNAIPSVTIGQQTNPGNLLTGADVEVTVFSDEAVGGRIEEITIPNGINVKLRATLHVANIDGSGAQYRPIVIGGYAPRGSRDLNSLDVDTTLYPTFTADTIYSNSVIGIYRLASDICGSGNTGLNTGYAWTASGYGTAEYYLELAAGGDPGLPMPTEVYAGAAAPATRLARPGTLGSLAAGSWGYGDNDNLGYATIYVRLSGGTDPDSSTMNADFSSQIRLKYDVKLDGANDNKNFAPVAPYSPAGSITNKRLILDYGYAVKCLSSVAALDPEPTVWGGVTTLLLNNGSAVDLTMFRDFGINGQVLSLTFANGNTTLKHSASSGTGLRLAGGVDATLNARDTLTLKYDGDYSQWLEIARSDNS